VLKFLGDVNLFHGRAGLAPGHDEGVSYVRPHELDIVAEPGDGTWAVTLAQTLTVGPNTRIEFRREEDGSFVDVELARDHYLYLRESLDLKQGRKVFLRPRRVTRFSVPA
jgi:sulfate transport system ATP-binding protein